MRKERVKEGKDYDETMFNVFRLDKLLLARFGNLSASFHQRRLDKS